MQDLPKAHYARPHFSITGFETTDLLMLSAGSDMNQGTWQPTKADNSLPIDMLEIRSV